MALGEEAWISVEVVVALAEEAWISVEVDVALAEDVWELSWHVVVDLCTPHY